MRERGESASVFNGGDAKKRFFVWFGGLLFDQGADECGEEVRTLGINAVARLMSDYFADSLTRGN